MFGGIGVKAHAHELHSHQQAKFLSQQKCRRAGKASKVSKNGVRLRVNGAYVAISNKKLVNSVSMLSLIHI